MASPVADIGQSHQHHPVTESAAESAFQEAQKWIEVSHGVLNTKPTLRHFASRSRRCFVVIVWP